MYDLALCELSCFDFDRMKIVKRNRRGQTEGTNIDYWIASEGTKFVQTFVDLV